MLARASLLSLVLIAAAPAFAVAPDTVLLEELTWTELRDAIGAGTTTILVPVGGTEQNGPHMAVGKHNVRVRVLAERIALALGHTLVAPVIAYVPEGRISPPTGHMRFPGTISVPEDTFERVLDAAARSFRQHGFRDVVFVGDHGSTQAGQRAVAARLNREWAGGPTRVHAIEEYYRASQVEFAHALRAKGYGEAEIGTHAGLADTALMLALDARLVRADRLRPGTGEAGDGVEGDPTRATAELGRAGADLVVTKTVEAVKRALARR